MLRINRQTDYAIRVIIALSNRDDESRTPSNTIRTEMHIPQSLMPRLVAQLANAGLIKTYTGRLGGLQISRPAAQITLKDVVEAFEGPLLLSSCMHEKEEDDCPFQPNCSARKKWGRVQAAMLREMASTNFADLALEQKSNSTTGFTPLSLM